MSHEEAADLCLRSMKTDPAKFYGLAGDLPLGAGMLLRNCPFPLEDTDSARFRTVLGIALVLTHECDLDQTNERCFNEHIVVLPILPLEKWVDKMNRDQGTGSWGGLLPKIAANDVFRVMYFPPIPAFINVPELKYGGLINLNTISSSPLSWHDHFQTKTFCSLSALGLRAFDYKLENHLLREKAAALWFCR